MKICIIGAGSSYTPELFEKFAQVTEYFPVKSVTLMDIDEKRLNAVTSFCKRYVQNLGFNVVIESTLDLDRAIYGSDFINTQIRVGGNKCRILDEKIPISMGLIGQETTGAGGFIKALRTIPVMMDIVGSMNNNAPDAWLINYANPTGIISQAIHDSDISSRIKAKTVALCSGGIRPAWQVAEALGLDAKNVECDIFGLNHLNYAYNIKINGRDITNDEFIKSAADYWDNSAELAIKIGALFSGYLQYYYNKSKVIEKQRSSLQTRGEEVLELEKEIFADFNNPDFCEKPPSLKKRGGDGYAQVAIDVMDAIYNDKSIRHVINVPNKGTFPFLPANAVIETAVTVDKSGIKPVAASPPPKPVWGLVSMVKNYEMMTAEAALSGDKDLAVLALTHHPLVGDYTIAKELFNKLLEANRDYLPEFWYR